MKETLEGEDLWKGFGGTEKDLMQLKAILSSTQTYRLHRTIVNRTQKTKELNVLYSGINRHKPGCWRKLVDVDKCSNQGVEENVIAPLFVPLAAN